MIRGKDVGGALDTWWVQSMVVLTADVSETLVTDQSLTEAWLDTVWGTAPSVGLTSAVRCLDT